MERIVYIRGKFRGTNKKMKEPYFYAKEMEGKEIKYSKSFF